MTTSTFGIVKTFNEDDFINEFKAYNRMDNFSYKGLRILFESLEQTAIDCQMNIEMDVIALCCEYNEDTIGDIIDNYAIDISECDSFDEVVEEVNRYLEDNTFVCGSYDIADEQKVYIYQGF